MVPKLHCRLSKAAKILAKASHAKAVKKPAASIAKKKASPNKVDHLTKTVVRH
jgi:hypothetical protein